MLEVRARVGGLPGKPDAVLPWRLLERGRRYAYDEGEAMKPSWWERSDRLHRTLVARNGTYEPYSMRDTELLVMALAGEVGELAQEFYKRCRDTRTQEEFEASVRSELPDIRIYLQLLQNAFGCTDEDCTEYEVCCGC